MLLKQSLGDKSVVCRRRRRRRRVGRSESRRRVGALESPVDIARRRVDAYYGEVYHSPSQASTKQATPDRVVIDTHLTRCITGPQRVGTTSFQLLLVLAGWNRVPSARKCGTQGYIAACAYQSSQPQKSTTYLSVSDVMLLSNRWEYPSWGCS